MTSMTPNDRELAEKLLCIWFDVPKITLGDDSVAKRGLAMAQTARTLITAELAAKAIAQHSDDMAVDVFASAMKEKLKFAREQKGRGGWENCPTGDLVDMLYAHLAKGDMRDVANFAMMLWHNLNGRPVLDIPDFAILTAKADALRAENERLREEMRDLYKGYVRTLESARDRIMDFGGNCDPVDVMEAGDPVLIKARA
ncbi:MAG: hypothetical protein KGI54_18620, partial [Pseudomonadota bacterium]|nr:hypothetical protein [Pseudomonadota bacterium]